MKDRTIARLEELGVVLVLVRLIDRFPKWEDAPVFSRPFWYNALSFAAAAAVFLLVFSWVRRFRKWDVRESEGNGDPG